MLSSDAASGALTATWPSSGDGLGIRRSKRVAGHAARLERAGLAHPGRHVLATGVSRKRSRMRAPRSSGSSVSSGSSGSQPPLTHVSPRRRCSS